MKGILMTPDNHLAIRDGRKTVTRRLDHLKEVNKEPDAWILAKAMRTMPPIKEGNYVCQHKDGHCIGVRPRYQVGDVVYIKETWCIGAYTHKKEADIVYRLDSTVSTVDWNDWLEQHTQYGGSNVVESKWRSPLFLPAWAARDFIQITDVGVGRVQEISREDIRLEGVGLPVSPRFTPRVLSELHQEFQSLWDSLNAKRGYGWSVNPWNFRYEFRRIEVKER